VTSIVTNGHLITPEWVAFAKGLVDQVGISVDSTDLQTRQKMGRAHLGKFPTTNDEYAAKAEALRAAGISLKINSVITAQNFNEQVYPFIARLRPDRWKIFQALQVDGQNALSAKDVVCDDAMYTHFRTQNEHKLKPATTTIFEDNDAMTGSYAMIDPYGRFFDNTLGHHQYSSPIFEGGFAKTYSEISVNHTKFKARGGEYSNGVIGSSSRESDY